ILIVEEGTPQVEKVHLEPCYTFVVGGSGLIGTQLREALAYTGLPITTLSRSKPEDLKEKELAIKLDLSTATTEQLYQIINLLRPERISYLAAWTDVKAAIALSRIFQEYLILSEIGLSTADPIYATNVRAVRNICEAIERLPEENRPELIIANTTFTQIEAVKQNNWYAQTKAKGMAIARTFTEIELQEVLFGYPYSTRAIESSRAKGSTLHWWITEILDKIQNPPQEEGEKLTPFNDDAVDHTNIHHVMRSLLRGEGYDFHRGWLTTTQVARIIIEEYCKLHGGDANELKEAILNPVSGDNYKPTVSKLLSEDNPVYQWLRQAAESQRIPFEQLLALKVDYARAYPKATDQEIEMSDPDNLTDPYIKQLRSDISQIVKNILEAK
ncbi:hypothetical protein ACFLY9_02840, partial [Patescibacteria group bacterium]